MDRRERSGAQSRILLDLPAVGPVEARCRGASDMALIPASGFTTPNGGCSRWGVAHLAVSVA